MASKILIATDGSAYSRKAVDYGMGIAKKLEAGVVAVFAVNLKSLEMYAIGHHDDIGGYEAAAAALKADGAKALEYVAEAGREAGVEVITKLQRGYPACYR